MCNEDDICARSAGERCTSLRPRRSYSINGRIDDLQVTMRHLTSLTPMSSISRASMHISHACFLMLTQLGLLKLGLTCI